MKSLIIRLPTAASVLTFSKYGAVAAVKLKSAHEHNALANMQSILWTSGPTIIDRWRPALERFTALAVAEAPKTNLSKVSLILGSLRATTKDPLSKGADAAISGDVAMANGDECTSKYQSYRAEDNTYQPFDDGPRRPCESALVLSHVMTRNLSNPSNLSLTTSTRAMYRGVADATALTTVAIRLMGGIASQPSAALNPLGRGGIECMALQSLASDRVG